MLQEGEQMATASDEGSISGARSARRGCRTSMRLTAGLRTAVFAIAATVVMASSQSVTAAPAPRNACARDTFGYDSNGRPLNDGHNLSEKCLFVRPDGYLWATEQYHVDPAMLDNDFPVAATFQGSVQLWVQDCSTGAVTNAKSTQTWSASHRDTARSGADGLAFTKVGTVIGNATPRHSYRVIARYIHGSVHADPAKYGRYAIYTDVKQGTAFGDSSTPCYQLWDSVPSATKPPSATSPKPAPSSCFDYSILGLRGSGEALSGPYRMGSTVGNTARKAVGMLRADKPGVTVRAYSIPYPALPVSALKKPTRFFASLSQGTQLLQSQIRSIAASCPQTRIGVIGYSQGAGAASEAMRGLPPAILAHVRATTLYADPFSAGPSAYAQTWDAFVPSNPKRAGHGIFGKHALPSALPHPLDICFSEDLVCALTRATSGKLGELFLKSVHSDYVDYDPGFAPSLPDLYGIVTAREMER
jgi:hypothetical protein